MKEKKEKTEGAIPLKAETANKPTRQEKIPFINDDEILGTKPTDEFYSLDLIDKALPDGQATRNLILESIRFKDGDFGRSWAMKFRELGEFRSGSQTIGSQCERLRELNAFPVRITLAKLISKGNRAYFSLRGVPPKKEVVSD
ncbi:MAG: hypothetical protein IMZ43_06460 [Thermoplasmata archaeon]|nr:hypothetical protein [Thermoplasmata archaeon]